MTKNAWGCVGGGGRLEAGAIEDGETVGLLHEVHKSSHNACVFSFFYTSLWGVHIPILGFIHVRKIANHLHPHTLVPTHLSPFEHTRLWNDSWFHANLKSFSNLATDTVSHQTRPDTGLNWTTSPLSTMGGVLHFSASPNDRTSNENPYESQNKEAFKIAINGICFCPATIIQHDVYYCQSKKQTLYILV